MNQDILDYLLAEEEFDNAKRKFYDFKHKIEDKYKPYFYINNEYGGDNTIKVSWGEVVKRFNYKIKYSYDWKAIAWFKGKKHITKEEYEETLAFIQHLEITDDDKIVCTGNSLYKNVPNGDKNRIKEFLLNEYLKIVNKEQTQ